jgi:hypothetical protein
MSRASAILPRGTPLFLHLLLRDDRQPLLKTLYLTKFSTMMKSKLNLFITTPNNQLRRLCLFLMFGVLPFLASQAMANNNNPPKKGGKPAAELPVAAFLSVDNSTVCSQDSFVFSAFCSVSSSTGWYRFELYEGTNPTGSLIQTIAINDQNATFASLSRTNNSSTDVNYPFYVRIFRNVDVTTGLNGTLDGSSSQSVAVRPKPIPTVTNTQPWTLCHNTVFSVSASTTVSPSVVWSYTTVPNGTNLPVSSSGFGNGVGFSSFTSATTNTTGADISGTIYFTAKYATGVECPTNSATNSLIVQSAPVIQTQPTAQTVCESSAATYSVALVAGNTLTPTYAWTATPGGAVGSDSNSYTTPAATDAMNGNSYTVNISNTCGNVNSDPAILTVNSRITATDAGSDETLCWANAAPVFNISASATLSSGASHTVGAWTGGAGTFGNAAMASTTYTPASSEIGQTVTLTWTVTDPDGTGPCVGGQTDQVALTINNGIVTASVNAGSDETLCWSTAEPVFNISATASRASGAAYTTGMWSGGAGTIASPSSASTTYTPDASEIGTTVNLTWTVTDPDAGDPCVGGQTDQVALTINNGIASANAGNDQTICQSTATVNISATATRASGAAYTVGTWTSSDMGGSFGDATMASTTYTHNIGAAGGSVTLTWTPTDPDGPGASAPCDALPTDALTLTVDPIAVVTMSALSSATICQGKTTTFSVAYSGSATSVTLDDGGAGGTFNTTTPASGATVTYTAAANSGASVTISALSNDPAGPCNAVTDSKVLTVNPNPTAPSGAINATMCEGATIPDVTVANPGAGFTIEWFDAAMGGNSLGTGLTYAPATAPVTAGALTVHTFYAETVNSTTGCRSATRTAVTLTVRPKPVISVQPLAPTNAICVGTTFTLNVTAAAVAPATTLSYLWRQGSTVVGSNSPTYSKTGAAVVATDRGIYTVSITDNNNCSVISDPADLKINGRPTVPATANIAAICVGTSTTIQGDGSTQDVNGVSTPMAPTTYTYWSSAAATTPPNATTVGTGSNGLFTVPTTATAGTKTIHIRAEGAPAGCNSTTQSFVFYINTLPSTPTTAFQPTDVCLDINSPTTSISFTVPNGNSTQTQSGVALTSINTYSFWTAATGGTQIMNNDALGSGTVAISGNTFTWSATSAGRVNVFVQAEGSPSSCPSARRTINLDINSTSMPTTAASTIVCSGSSVTVTATGSTQINNGAAATATGVTYKYYDNAVGGTEYLTGASFGGGTGTLTISGTTNQTVVFATGNTIAGDYDIWIEAIGTQTPVCASARRKVTISVLARPSLPTTANPALACQGTVVSIIGSGSTQASTTSYTPAAPTYSFFTDATGTTAVSNTNFGIVTSGTLNTRTTLAAGKYNVYIRANGVPSGCNSATLHPVVLTLNGRTTTPTAVASPTTICNGGTLTITPTGGNYADHTGSAAADYVATPAQVGISTAPTSYSVYDAATGATQTAVTDLFTALSGTVFTLKNTVTPGRYTVYVSADATNPTGCEGTRRAVTFTVNGIPTDPTYTTTGTAVADVITVCKNDASFTITGTNSTQDIWNGTVFGPVAITQVNYRYYTAATGTTQMSTITGFSITSGVLTVNPTTAAAGSRDIYVDAIGAPTGCNPVNRKKVTVVINPLPTLTTVSAPTVCPNPDMTATADVTVSGLTAAMFSPADNLEVTYTVNAGSTITADLTQIGSSTQGTFTVTNAQTADITVNISQIRNKATGCIFTNGGAGWNTTIVVNNITTMSDITTNTLPLLACENYDPSAGVLKASAAIADGDITYDWESSLDNAAFSSAGTNSPYTSNDISSVNNANFSSLSVGTYLFRLKVTSTLNGVPCPSFTSPTAAVVIRPQADAPTFTPTMAVLCEGEYVKLTAGLTAAQLDPTASGKGVNPVYSWHVANDLGGSADSYGTSLGSSDTLNTGVLTENKWFKLSITDNGPGCTPSEVEHLVEVNNISFDPMTLSPDLIVCSDDPFNMGRQLSALDGNPTFLWEVKEGATGTYAAPTGTPFDTDDSMDTDYSDISDNNNQTDSAKDYYFKLTVTSDLNGKVCTITDETKVTIKPEPVKRDTTSTVSVCSDEATNYVISNTDNSGGTITSYDIDVNTLPMGLTAAGTNATDDIGKSDFNYIKDDVFTNTTSGVLNVVYTITPYMGTCQGDNYTITIPINPEPVVAAQTANVCSDIATGVTLGASSTIAAATYDITVNANGLTASAGVAAMAYPAAGVTNSEIVDDAWTNKTAANVDVVYTVVPVSADGCKGDAFTVTVTIRPEPFLNTINAPAVCSQALTSYTLPFTSDMGAVSPVQYKLNSVTYAPLTVSYVFPDPQPSLFNIGNDLNLSAVQLDKWTNVTNVQQTAVYKLQPKSGAGCYGDEFTVNIPVNPEPVKGNEPTATAVCSDVAIGATIPLVDNDNGTITKFDVTANVGALAGTPTTGTNLTSASAIAADVFTNTTSAAINAVYTITPYMGTCAGASYTITVPVNPEPVVVNQDVTVCSDAALGITLNNDADTPQATTYNITNINANGLTSSATTPLTTGTGKLANSLANEAWTNATNAPVDVEYTVVPVSADGCEGNSFTVTATINPELIIGNQTATVCSDVALNFSLDALATGNDTYTYTVASANATAVAPASDRTTASNAPIIDTYHNVSDATVNVTYTITPYLDGCPGTPFNYVVSVKPEPTSTNKTVTACSGVTNNVNVTLMDQVNTPNGNGVASTFVWSGTDNFFLTGEPYGTSTTSTIGAATVVNEATTTKSIVYTVTPTSTGGCVGSTFDVTVNVYGTPQESANAGGDNTLCNGEMRTLSGLGTGGTAPLTHVWTVVAGSSTNATAIFNTVNPASPIMTPSLTDATMAGTLVVRHQIVDDKGCVSGTTDLTFTINPNPVANAIVGDDTPCANAVLAYNVTTNNSPANTYSWNLASGGTITSTPSGNVITITYSGAGGPHTISVTETVAATGCSTVNTLAVNVQANPTATTTKVDVLCKGDATGSATVIPMGANNGTAYTYAWSNSANTATASTLVAGTYIVTVTVDGMGGNAGCSVTATATVNEPAQALSISNSSQTNVDCFGNSTGAVTVVAGGGTSPYQYKLANGSYQVSGSFSNLAQGIYTITAKDANNCTKTLDVTITEPTELMTNSSSVNPTCLTATDGSVTIMPSGGTAPYEYKKGTGAYSINSSFTALGVGPHSFTVRDANGCEKALSITLMNGDATPPTLTAAADGTIALDANCQVTIPNVKGTATDNCVVASHTQSIAMNTVQSATHNAEITITVTATDDAGLTVTDDVILIAKDVTAPVLTPAADQTVALNGMCKITVPNVIGTATDNCTGTGIIQSPTAGTVVDATHNETINVTVTATDAAGLTDVETVVLTAKDVTAPVLTPAADQTVALNGMCKITVPNVIGTATDNCAGTGIIQSPTAGTVVDATHNETISVTVTATDAAGLTDVETVVLTAKDVTAPVLTAAADQTVGLNGTCKITVPNVTGTATDNCAGTGITQSPTAGTVVDATHNETINVTVTATDAAGLTDVETVVLTAKDVDAPVLTAAADQTVGLNGTCKITVPNVTGTATDNCAGTGITQSPTAGTVVDATHNETISVTVTATDAAGLTDVETVVLTAKDITAPVLTAAADQTVGLNGTCKITVPNVTGTATDNCAGTGIIQSPTAGTVVDATHNETINVTVTATDAAGLTDVETVVLTAKDVTLPTFTQATGSLDVTLSCSQTANITTALALVPTATDNCGTANVTLTNDDTVNGVCANSYVRTRVWTVNDGNGNTATYTQVITVGDNQIPTISGANNVTVSEAQYLAWNGTTATDDCGTPTLTHGTDVTVSLPASGCYTYINQITRTWTATDACGNSTSAVQVFTVRGVTFTCPTSRTGANALLTTSDGINDYNCSTLVTNTNTSSTGGVNPTFPSNDPCLIASLAYSISGVTTGSGNGTIAGTRFNTGTSTVRYTVTTTGDFCEFQIQVRDLESPTISAASTIVRDACDLPGTFPTTTPDNTITINDNCGMPTLMASPTVADITSNVSGCATKAADLKYTKSWTRLWVVTDAAGNTATRSQILYLRDKQAPNAICQPKDVTIGTTNISYAADRFNNGSSDGCGGALTYSACIGAGCTNFATNLTLSRALVTTGTTNGSFIDLPVRLRVRDACNNESICTTTLKLTRGTTAVTPLVVDANIDDKIEDISNAKVEDNATPSDINTAHGSMKCFPNPFSEDLNIDFTLAKDVQTTILRVYDNQGRLATSLDMGDRLAGYHQVRWNLADLQSGLYYICLELNGKCVKTERVLMMK